jgi:signal transduction histidine kinase
MAVIEIRSVPQLPLLAAQMEKIFDLGYRADNARAIVASGTGLGLYICRQLVERVHGGRISVSWHKDQLEFMIKLPRGKGPGDG